MRNEEKVQSTFEREMQDPHFRDQFETEYDSFLLSEIISSLMEENEKSVRKLAKEVGLSPTVIQNIRAGKQEDIKLSNFMNISRACGYHLFLQKGGSQIAL